MVRVLVVGSGSAGISIEVIRQKLAEKGIVENIEIVESFDDSNVCNVNANNLDLLLNNIDEKFSYTEHKSNKKHWKKSCFWE